MIRHRCPACKATLENEDAMGGRTDRCPLCGALCEVPLSKAQKAEARARQRQEKAPDREGQDPAGPTAERAEAPRLGASAPAAAPAAPAAAPDAGPWDVPKPDRLRLFLGIGVGVAVATFALTAVLWLLPSDSGPAGRRSGPGGTRSGQGPAGGKQALLADLIAKGDAALKSDKRMLASNIYDLAGRYGTPGSQIAERLRKAAPRSWSLSNAEIGRAQEAIYLCSREDCADWPPEDAKMVLVELAMLQDERLVGNLRWHFGSFQNGPTLRYFLAAPKRTVAQVRSTYGPPSSQKTEQHGADAKRTVVTYGRLRLIAEESGRIRTVLIGR